MAQGPSIQLNPQQKIAAEHVHGPMLVRAGAGTGKTTVLVERIAYLIAEGHAKPDEIVATTYTLKAVGEIRQRVRRRVEEELGPDAGEVRVTNFHEWCWALLQEHKTGFNLLTKEQLYVFLRQQIDARRLPLRYFQKASNPAKFLADMMDFMERCQDELVDAARYRAFVETLRSPGATLPRFYRSKEAETISREEIIARCEEVADVYEAVEKLLASKRLGSFGQLIVRALELLRNDDKVLARERARSRFILIDEFQDSNLAQIELADLVTGPEKNIFAVGDPDQAIYRFRGASSAAFQSFMQRFPQAKTVTLAENRRSRAHILSCAHSVIKANVEREAASYARQPLAAFRGASEHKVELVVNHGNEAEAGDIAKRIDELLRAGEDPAEIAVLYRQHNHREELVKELDRRGIPYAISGTDLFKTDMLRDVVAAMRALDSATDHISLFRLALLPRFGIDVDDLRHRLRVAGRERGVAGALQGMPAGKKLLMLLAALQKQHPAASADAVDVFAAVVRLLDHPPEALEITAMRKFMEEWRDLEITTSTLLGAFLKYLEYFQEGGGKLSVEDRDEDAIQLTTVHTAKGLEYRHVFVIRVSSNSFPSTFRRKLFEFPETLRSASAFEAEDDKTAHEEEERRLFYVAVTRAKDTLALHGKRSRAKADPLPPKYIRELAADRSVREVILQREAEFVVPSLAASADTSEDGDSLPLQGSLFASAPVRSLSASGIETYKTCPLKFKFSREDGIPDEAGAALQYGSAMHQVLRDFYQARVAGRPLDELALIERFRAAMRESRMEDPLQFELYEKQGEQHLKQFLAGTARIPVNVLATEENFQIMVEGVTVRGRFDRVDRLEGGGLRVLDYKTGNPKDEKAAEESLQLALYAIAAQEKYGQLPRVAFHNIENDAIVEVVPQDAMLKKARAAVHDTAGGIAAGRFQPTPGFFCRWCAYSILCPATAEKIYTIQPAAATSGV